MKKYSRYKMVWKRNSYVSISSDFILIFYINDRFYQGQVKLIPHVLDKHILVRTISHEIAENFLHFRTVCDLFLSHSYKQKYMRERESSPTTNLKFLSI